ncbi:hypothetical protein T02_8503 [Trichinella nativa]|uniref:Uncharacterized protein n=1 Tax=Trichinella nativa TaxID=6335 RepID=A0A0V1KHB0_9BILA|nr:hypothetical protein T02_8503 [Trichinella nativa]
MVSSEAIPSSVLPNEKPEIFFLNQCTHKHILL